MLESGIDSYACLACYLAWHSPVGIGDIGGCVCWDAQVMRASNPDHVHNNVPIGFSLTYSDLSYARVNESRMSFQEACDVPSLEKTADRNPLETLNPKP